MLPRAFPDGSARIHLQCKRHRRCRFDSWGRKMPWRRKWQPTPVFLPGRFHGLKSLLGYSPWVCTESDTTGVTWHTCRCSCFPGALVVRNLPDNAGDIRDMGLIPWRRAWQPTLVFLPGRSRGQRSLMGYRPKVTKSWTRLTHPHP